MSSPQATINTPMREAFLKADISRTSSDTLKRVALAAQRGLGRVKRYKLWNKGFADGPRPSGCGKFANLRSMGL